MLTVTAVRNFVYDGRSVSIGDRLDVSPIVAAALKYQCRVVLSNEPASPEAPTVRTKRRYRRRDLTADAT